MKRPIYGILSYLLLFCLSASCHGAVENTADTIDVELSHGTYRGFGIGIHPPDILYADAFDALAPRFVRMELGPLWANLPELIPAASSVDELKAYIARNYDGDAHDRLSGARYSHDFLKARDIEIMLIHFDLPYHWRAKDSSARIHAKHMIDLARFYTAHLLFLQEHGIQIDYIELANEPDGFWNGHITPTDYADLVVLCDELFRQHQLTHVKVLGPGLTFLNLHGASVNYLQALKNKGADKLYGWSTHCWDEVEFRSSRPEYTYGVWQPFLDNINATPGGDEKPIFVTEYGSDITQFGDRTWPSPRDQKTETSLDSWPLAIRIMANSISHLNRGANALILYRLSNAHWHTTGWGIIQPEENERFSPKPIYHLLERFISDLPVGMRQLQPIWYTHDDPITLSAFHQPETDQTTLLIVNSSETTQNKTLHLKNHSNIKVLEQSGLHELGDFKVQLTIQPSTNNTPELSVSLPPESAARIIFTSQTH